MSIDAIDDRLGKLKFDLSDGLNLGKRNVAGRYVPHVHRIVLTRLAEYTRWAIFVHEVMHGLSGHAGLLMEELDGDGYADYVSLKVGLGVGYDGRSEFLHWLNEAVTEQITQDLLNGRELLSGNCDNGSYITERKKLNDLIVKGVPKNLIIRAYFEDYDAASRGHKMPAMRELMRVSNELLGKGGLFRFHTEK